MIVHDCRVQKKKILNGIRNNRNNIDYLSIYRALS